MSVVERESSQQGNGDAPQDKSSFSTLSYFLYNCSIEKFLKQLISMYGTTYMHFVNSTSASLTKYFTSKVVDKTVNFEGMP